MDKLSVILIIISGISWGSVGLFTTPLREIGFSSMAMSGIRNIIAGLLMVIYALITGREKFKTKPKELFIFALSGISILATSTLYYISTDASSLSTAVVLMYTSPVMIMIVSVMFLGEKFTWFKMSAILLALAGCGLVTGIIGGIKFSVYGIITGFLSGVAYTVYNISVKISMKRGNDPVTASTYCFLFGGLASLFIINPSDAINLISIEPAKAILLLVCLGFFTGAFPYFIYTIAMRKMPAGVASAMSIIEPMSATLISVIVFGEKLSFSGIAGIILIAASVVMLSLTDEK